MTVDQDYELARTLADGEYWKRWAELFDWTLASFTFRDSATFRDPLDDSSVTLTAAHLRAIEPLREFQDRIVERLAQRYRVDAPAVAQLCDLHLDRSGKLLGEVRKRMRENA